jgi:hypothetical protein
MINSVNMERDQWQMGKTKVFIKAPESVRTSYVLIRKFVRLVCATAFLK